MQQDEHWRVRSACLPVEDVDVADALRMVSNRDHEALLRCNVCRSRPWAAFLVSLELSIAAFAIVAAVDAGSLSKAARQHGRSAATVSRAVALLERLAGDNLLLRSTRRLSLTPVGDAHVAIWRDVLAQLGGSSRRGPPPGFRDASS
jgi:hypothetical protein